MPHLSFAYYLQNVYYTKYLKKSWFFRMFGFFAYNLINTVTEFVIKILYFIVLISFSLLLLFPLVFIILRFLENRIIVK